MKVIDPREITAMEWFDTTIDLFSGVIPPVVLRDPERDWREWARHSRQISVRGILTPDPDTFDDWRDWAFRFNQVVSTL